MSERLANMFAAIQPGLGQAIEYSVNRDMQRAAYLREQNLARLQHQFRMTEIGAERDYRATERADEREYQANLLDEQREFDATETARLEAREDRQLAAERGREDELLAGERKFMRERFGREDMGRVETAMAKSQSATQRRIDSLLKEARGLNPDDFIDPAAYQAKVDEINDLVETERANQVLSDMQQMRRLKQLGHVVYADMSESDMMRMAGFSNDQISEYEQLAGLGGAGQPPPTNAPVGMAGMPAPPPAFETGGDAVRQDLLSSADAAAGSPAAGPASPAIVPAQPAPTAPPAEPDLLPTGTPESGPGSVGSDEWFREQIGRMGAGIFNQRQAEHAERVAKNISGATPATSRILTGVGENDLQVLGRMRDELNAEDPRGFDRWLLTFLTADEARAVVERLQ